jgi:hypothetical protein
MLTKLLETARWMIMIPLLRRSLVRGAFGVSGFGAAWVLSNALAVVVGAVLILSGCATPSSERLQEFAELPKDTELSQHNDSCTLHISEVAPETLKDMFRTSQVSRRFTVFWLSVDATGANPIEFRRSRIVLDTGQTRNYPVGPGRLSYLCRSNASMALLAAAVVVPVAGPAIATVGSGTYVAVNMTGIAATAHTAGESASNRERAQESRLGSMPEEAILEPGQGLKGFVFFEFPRESIAMWPDCYVCLPLRIGEEWKTFELRDIPRFEAVFNKEK